MKQINKNIILLANGKFPTNKIALDCIENANLIICCDGAVDKAIKKGYCPDYIIGDLDSIKNKTYKEAELIHIPDQNENDLRKSIYWIEKNGGKEVIILGATGNREDHTLGNIFSMFNEKFNLKLKIITDYGQFIPIKNKMTFTTFIDQPISFFCISPKTKITSKNLKYPLKDSQFKNLYAGTLNSAISNTLNVTITDGMAMIYLAHKDVNHE